MNLTDYYWTVLNSSKIKPQTYHGDIIIMNSFRPQQCSKIPISWQSEITSNANMTTETIYRANVKKGPDRRRPGCSYPIICKLQETWWQNMLFIWRLKCTLASPGWGGSQSDAWGLQSPACPACCECRPASRPVSSRLHRQMKTINPPPPSAPEQSSSAEVSKLCGCPCMAAPPHPPHLPTPPPSSPPSQATRV